MISPLDFSRMRQGRSVAPAIPAATTVIGRARRALAQRSLSTMFKSAMSSKNDKWTSIPMSPDAFIAQMQPVLVARSREQWSNNDYMKSFIRLAKQNIVGEKGIQLQAKVKKPRGKLDTDANRALEQAWSMWCEKGNCDVTGQLSLRALCELVVETTARDGEYIIRKVYGADAGPFQFALQMIDPQRLLVNYMAENYGQNGNFIRNGIEFNRYGRPVAYHFTSTDERDSYWYSISGRGFVRVPADEIIHGFRVEMVGQRRGIPWASTSLSRLHHLAGFEDASVQNARASATKMGFIEWLEGFGPTADDDTDVAQTIDAEPLSFHELPEGAKLTQWNPTYPTGEYAVFTKSMLRGFSAGVGLLYNNVAGDLEGVNFSSIRQGTLDERENWKVLQQWLIETLLSPVFAAWLQWALLRGDIASKGRAYRADRLADFRVVTWQGRRWTWVDPQADVNAAASEVRMGSRSISSVIREKGNDPQEVFREIAEDLEQMASAGIPDKYIQLFMFGELPPPPPPAKAPEDNKDAA